MVGGLIGKMAKQAIKKKSNKKSRKAKTDAKRKKIAKSKAAKADSEIEKEMIRTRLPLHEWDESKF